MEVKTAVDTNQQGISIEADCWGTPRGTHDIVQEEETNYFEDLAA